MTINELLALNGLTANDEIPVWDAEAAPNEPTKKITGSNLAASIKTLCSLLGMSDVVDSLIRDATKVPSAECVYDALATKTVTNFFTPDTNRCSFNSTVSFCKQSGNIVNLLIAFTPSAVRGTFGTVASGIRPNTAIYAAGINNTDDKSEGTFVISGANFNAYGLTVNKMYIVNFVYLI